MGLKQNELLKIYQRIVCSKINIIGHIHSLQSVRMFSRKDLDHRSMNLPAYNRKVVAEPQRDTGILGLQRKRIQSGAREEA